MTPETRARAAAIDHLYCTGTAAAAGALGHPLEWWAVRIDVLADGLGQLPGVGEDAAALYVLDVVAVDGRVDLLFAAFVAQCVRERKIAREASGVEA